MARSRASHRCAECGTHHPKWAGRCDGCGAWATLVEVAPPDGGSGGRPSGRSGGGATRFQEVAPLIHPVQPTGLEELDRALGGGLVAGSVTLLGGDPGIGKSTLLLQLAAALGGAGLRVLYVSAEESAAQLRRRADRLDASLTDVWIQPETRLAPVLETVAELAPDVLLLDSIQTVAAPHLASAPGSVAQVRESAQVLVDVAKERAMATVLTGHVTKDGALAGPRTLEHLVDTVLEFEGDRHQPLRFLRAVKHRFGPTGEPGVLEMSGRGLQPVPDPSGLFLTDRRAEAPGSVVVAAVDGHRPVLVEMQALVVPTRAVTPRRATQGVESGRLAMLLAVLERRCGLAVLSAEVYASVVGGVRVVDPGTDLGVALAVASAVRDRPVGGEVVACGEVGLSGELRRVSHMGRRLQEAARLGFRSAIVPATVDHTGADIELHRAVTVGDAIRQAGLGAGVRPAA